MDLKLDLLSTRELCDAQIEIFTSEKVKLERRKRNLGEALEGRSSTALSTAEGIASSQAIISSFETASASINDEDRQRQLALDIKEEQVKLQRLQNRQANYGPTDVNEDIMDYDRLAAEIPVIEEKIAMVEAHKTTLTV